jgi:hypothetical protein
MLYRCNLDVLIAPEPWLDRRTRITLDARFNLSERACDTPDCVLINV